MKMPINGEWPNCPDFLMLLKYPKGTFVIYLFLFNAINLADSVKVNLTAQVCRNNLELIFLMGEIK